MIVTEKEIECNNKVLAQKTREMHFNDKGKKIKDVIYIEYILRHVHIVEKIKTKNIKHANELWEKIIL